MLHCKIRNGFNAVHKLFSYKEHCLTHKNDIGIVADIAGGCTEMDYAFCKRATLAVGFDMRHNIVPESKLIFGCSVIIDVIYVFFHLLDLLIGNLNTKLFFALCKSNPKLSPSRKLAVIRKNVFHFVA